jgi:maltooligosyltrehalose synthase
MEPWDFSLVDPDNRRPVDFAAQSRRSAIRLRRRRLLARWPHSRCAIARLLCPAPPHAGAVAEAAMSGAG